MYIFTKEYKEKKRMNGMGRNYLLILYQFLIIHIFIPFYDKEETMFICCALNI